MKLTLGQDGGGPRHFLCGEPVHCGASLEMRVGGKWIPVRYEASLTADPPRILLFAEPWGEDGPEVAVQQAEYQDVRWPKS